MSDYLALFLQAAFSENIMLVFFLGICTAIATSKSMEAALGAGVAIFIVQSVTVPLNSLLNTYLFRPGALAWAGLPEIDLSGLGLIASIGVIAATVQLLEMLIDKHFPRLYNAFGVFLPLITVNCAILGGSLFSIQRNYDLVESVVFGLGSGAGWALTVILLAGIREKLRYANVPEGLEGTGITFIVMGLMAMSFMGLSGIYASYTNG
jgi:Na+-transporting NADH:ubiquinone oxidoreductase subunit E